MNIYVEIFLLIVGFIMLLKGADYFVDGASLVASKLGISQLVIGLTVVAMGTSMPEAAVSITAAVKENGEITIGNIVGSNILNILIILGISSVIVSLKVASSTVRMEIPYMIVITFILLLLGMDGVIDIKDGAILIAFFVIYIGYAIFSAKKNPVKLDNGAKEMSNVATVISLIGGLVLIVFGSDITVDAASHIARAFNISDRFIGLTIVALGTSLPELFTSVNAARKGNADIAIGNIIGSNIFNILFIIGVSAIITPVTFIEAFRFDSIIAILAGIILLLCCIKSYTLKRWAGILMLIFYAIYFVIIV